jgi:AraC-like DNA-binding protein
MGIDLRETHILGPTTYQRLVGAERCPALAAHGIAEVGLSRCDRAFRVLVDRPAAAQGVFVLDHAGAVLVDGAWRRVSEQACYLCPPGLRRGYHAVEQDFHFGWIAWLPGAVPGMPQVPTLTQRPCEALAESIRQLWREVTGAGEAVMLAHLVPLVRQQVGRLLGAHRRLDCLWEEVDADPAHPWTVADLASRISVSDEQLRRLCRAEHDQGPMERVRGLRLDRAAALLRSTTMPVAAVGAATGYADPEAFATAFRRRFGCGPTAWRAASGSRG